MTAPPITDVASLLYLKPSASGGRLCVAESGVSVRTVFCLYNEGRSPEQIFEDYDGTIPLPGVYAAIAYYLANKARLDAELEADNREFDELKEFYEKHGRLPDRYQ